MNAVPDYFSDALSREQKQHDYYRSISYFFAGFFLREWRALEDDEELKPQDMIAWAAQMLKLEEPK